MKKSHWRHLCALLLAMAVLAPATLLTLPASANPGLTVSNAILITDVSPGQTLTQKMTVSIGNTDRATDIAVQVMGMAQSPDGTFGALGVSQDTSSYSARPFITVDKNSFHLEPGASHDVTATIQVPQDVGDGGQYAMINIATQPVGGAGVNIIAAVNVPIYLTIKDSQLIHTGKITALTTSEVVSGQPVNIFTTFQNTGNHHFKVKGEVTVSNAQGATLDTIDEALTASSIVPTMSRQLQATYIPNGELSSGVYSVKSKIMLEDGTLLDEASNTFEVTTQYVPPPAVGTIKLTPSSASTLTSADGKISIYFAQGSAVVPVEVSLQNYPADQVPALPQSLSLATTCFRVEGLTGLLAKEATVTVNYTAADLDKAGGDASRLRLARWDEGTNQWILLKTSVDTGAMTLSASSNQMSIGAVVVGGTGSSSPFGAINPWLVIGGAAGVVIIVLLVYFLVVRRRRA